jgi:hypothetical protein
MKFFCRVPLGPLKIKKRSKNGPNAVNNPNKKIGMLLEARAGDVIWYYKTDDKMKEGISIRNQDIGISKIDLNYLSWVVGLLKAGNFCMIILTSHPFRKKTPLLIFNEHLIHGSSMYHLSIVSFKYPCFFMKSINMS